MHVLLLVGIIDQSRLNYEEQNQYKIRIQFSNQSNFFEENFLINIEDINESPYNLQCSNQTRFCTAFDEDFNQTLKFQIKTINNLDYEIICTDNGQPPLSVSIWIEVLPDNLTLIFVPIYSLIIPVNDDNNKIDKQTQDNIVILYFNDGDKTERQRRQANSPPQDIYFNIFYLTVPENSRDFQIANVYVVDDDSDNYTCSVYTYNTPNDIQPFEINSGILRISLTVHNNNYEIDFEKIPVYDITVTCYDPIHHFSIAKNFTINVIDVNEPPIELTLIPNTLPENSVTGYIIGQFHTVDPDIFSKNQKFEYTIITDVNHIFRIENDQLILNRNNKIEMCISQPDLCPHDYEQISSLYVRISVQDNDEPRISQKFWIKIKITDENDSPINLQLNGNFIKENSPIGTLIGEFSVQDQDLYQIQTFFLLNENIFLIENNFLRLARSLDYEQESFVFISVQVIDNGTIPKNITNDFLIKIIDVDEFPNTYSFISNNISNNTIDDLINGKQPIQTNYLPQNAYFQASLGCIVFLIEDRNRDINLNIYNQTNENRLSFSKPTCQILTENPYRLLCTSIISVINPHSIYGDEHLIITPLILTINQKIIKFQQILTIKFENITLIIDNKLIQSIDIPKDNSTSFQIGSIHAIDLVTLGQPLQNVILNTNNSLSYPLEIVNSTILKLRDDVNFSLINSSLIFNVSLFVKTTGEDNRIIEKYLIVNIKNKMDFNLTLSNNKIMENCHENTLIGYLILENGIGNYTFNLNNERFKLNGTNLLTARKYIEHCHIKHICSFDYETEPIINLTIEISDSKFIRLINFSIEIQDENELPYNLTLSTQSIPENTTIDSIVGFINAIDDDFNQTLIYTTDNPTFNIINNQLILKTKLNYTKRKFINLFIRAIDNGQRSLSVEKLFNINVTTNNRPPISVTSNPMIILIPEETKSTALIIGRISIIDPDVEENFTITFNKSNFVALTPTIDSYSMITDDGFLVYGQIYNITILDLNPPSDEIQMDYFVNVTANIMDSGDHSINYAFFVHYVPRFIINSTILSTISPLTTRIASLSQALHISIYETTPPNTPIIRGLLNSSSLNNIPTCITIDDRNVLFPINTTQSSFIIFLPNNYTLNSTIRPTILINVHCNIVNGINVNQDIVIDVLPAPPTIQINFNQTKTFYSTNNHTILGTFSCIELTTTPTNRTYYLSLRNNRHIFQLLSNGSLIQIGLYPSNLLQFNNSHINLTIQALETTSNKPTRIIQKIFSIPILINSSKPLIIFSRTSIPNDTNPNTIIENLTVHNLATPYRLKLIDTYNNGLELDSNRNSVILKRKINTFTLMNNQTELPIKIQLINQINQTILKTIFPLKITYPCLNNDCGNGTCIQSNQTLSYCLCTSGYTGIDCRIIDSCAYNPCTNNGICHQLTSTGDFSCQCLPNYSGLYCEILINICQLNTSLCSSTDICIPINNFFTCISKDELQYLVFDYLNNLDFINDENLFPTENIFLSERKILGPEKYYRAELISIVIPSLNNSLELFCINQSLIINSFAWKICSGYKQAIYLDRYFKSTPNFCPNCSFIDAADKYYWFDKTIPFLPLWITLIVGSVLMTFISLIPSSLNARKKVLLPLIKAKLHIEDEKEEDLILAKSVRTAVKINRERNDSGYESNEDTDNYIEQIVNNYQQEEFHVYPVLHESRSPNIERRGTTIDDLITSNSRSNISQRYNQRSSSISSQKLRRQSSIGNSQTLKPILHRRSTLFDSSIGTLIRLTGTPKLNNNDNTYLSTTFRSENTSKFVIGTLWNTFALVNNLFLQRPTKRRNALSGETNIQSEQLTNLQRLYSLAKQDREKEYSTNNLQSIITEALLEPQTKNLQSIVFDILSSNKKHHCNCYENHHIPSCIYYDHSLPYITRFNDKTSELEQIFEDMMKPNKRKYQDAATQSYVEKPSRTFTHLKSTNNVATQSSIRGSKINISTQTIDYNKNNFNSNNTDLIRLEPKINNPIVNEDISTRKPSILNQLKPKPIENNNNNNIYDRRNSLMNELKQVLASSSSSKQEKIPEENKSLPNHTVRSLVSMFETTSTIKNLNLLISQKPIINLSNVLTPPESTLLNISSEEIQSSSLNNTIEQYANDIASNILDNAVLTATTTTLYHNEQLQRRFSFYKNGGGHGKNLLFQANTFLPSTQQEDQNSRAESQSPTIILNDPLPLSIPINTENESQHTLIVGQYVDGNESNESKTNKRHSLTLDTKFDLDSLSSASDDEQINHRQYLSNSQLFSAQKLYIRPWLVRRATAPNIHSLDNDICDTRIEIINSSIETFFRIFPKKTNLDLYTRYTCLITILFYLRYIHDEYSNKILYDEIEQIEKEFQNSPLTRPSSTIHSNSFQTINLDGSKRYRTGLILDINSSDLITRRKILSQQIEWKRVKMIIRRFRKKYRYYKQLIKNDQKLQSNQLNIENYFIYFDSTSKRRIKKYAKHYAEKL